MNWWGNSGNMNGWKYMKIKFNSDDELPLNKTTEIPSMIIVVRAIFLENSKCYWQVFLDECLYKLQKWRVKINSKKLILKIVGVVIWMIYESWGILMFLQLY